MKQYEVVQQATVTRWVFIAAFWMWGLGYGMHAVGNLIQAEGLSGLSATTSSAVAMRLLAWIGGLIMFGVPVIATPTKTIIKAID